MAAVVETIVRTYGNWRRPRKVGLGALGMLGTIVVFVGAIIAAIMVALGGIIPAIVTGVIVTMALVPTVIRDKHGKSWVSRAGTWIGFRRSRRDGSGVYRSGPLGMTPWGTFQLPGLAAPSRLSQWEDGYKRPFALLYVPWTGHYTVVLACEPDGASLVDQTTMDTWVARWGTWLNDLGMEPGLVAASVTIETAPDTGSRLAREIDNHVVADAPELARQVMEEIRDSYPQGSATIRAYLALTFTATLPGGQRRTVDEMGRDLATRLPGLTGSLSQTGAGSARPLTAEGLCEVVRIAYDPAAAILIDEARSQGQPTSLRWPDVGPTAHQADWDSYRHDGAVSVTWSMTGAPRGTVFESVLARLLSPHADIDRKRVTLLYRPVDAARAAAIVEADLSASTFRVTSSDRPTARSLFDQKSAQAQANDEARGAGLINFGILMTATVTDRGRLPAALAAMDTLTPTARLMVRPVYGSQDSAFASALPLGLVIPRHLKVPSYIRENL